MLNDENAQPVGQRNGGRRSAVSKPAEVPAALSVLLDAGARFEHGRWACDSFKFAQQLKSAMLRPGAKEALLSALSEEWAESSRLEAALQPMHMADAPSAVKDSLVRRLLHVEPLQTELACELFQLLPQHEEAEPEARGAMRLTTLILAQFKWLEFVADGRALIDAARQATHSPSVGTPHLLTLPMCFQCGSPPEMFPARHVPQCLFGLTTPVFFFLLLLFFLKGDGGRGARAQT